MPSKGVTAAQPDLEDDDVVGKRIGCRSGTLLPSSPHERETTSCHPPSPSSPRLLPLAKSQAFHPS
jgi:hypothetical protein